LLTGPIVLDGWLDLAGIKPDWTLFIIPLNFYYMIIGSPLRIDAVQFVSNGFETLGPGVVSNVGTSFGTYYLIGGFPFAIFITILFAILCYHIYCTSFKSYNYFTLFLTWFLLTICTLSFFVQYFTLLPFYEFPLFFLLLVFLLKSLNRATKNINSLRQRNK